MPFKRRFKNFNAERYPEIFAKYRIPAVEKEERDYTNWKKNHRRLRAWAKRQNRLRAAATARKVKKDFLKGPRCSCGVPVAVKHEHRPNARSKSDPEKRKRVARQMARMIEYLDHWRQGESNPIPYRKQQGTFY